MEADAQRVAMLASGLQQRSRIGQIHAELGRKAQFRIIGRNAQTHQQRKIPRRLPCRIRGGRDDLLQFLDRVEAEGADAMDVIGFANGAAGFHRMHEAQSGFRQHRTH